jgi:peptide/nickel transport system substrate-binding protein
MLAYLKFRFQRSIRRFRRDVRLWRIWAVNYFDRHIWGKWRQIRVVRRFVISWWLVLLFSVVGLAQQIGALESAYITKGPAPGGAYREGMLGSVKAINPILPQSQASVDISRLIFNGLMRLNSDGDIETDLAQKWQISDDGKSYTFQLRPGVKWHDGAPFTAQDILFTLNLIQNPDTRSPLASSWQGVTAAVKDDRTITFNLPNQFAPFIYSATFGILPQHLLNGIDPSSLRVSDFNQHPVGTGPFKLDRMNEDGKSVSLLPNPNYYFGAPQLQQFEFKFYSSTTQLRRAYSQRQVDALGRVSSMDLPKLAPAYIHNMTLLDEVCLFMRTSSPILQDKAVRQAVSAAVNRSKIAKSLQSEVATPLTLPILPGLVGYTPAHQPPAYDPSWAAGKLEEAGWTAKKTGLRQREGQELKLNLVTSDGGNYPHLASLVKSDLEKIGINVKIISVGLKDLQQSYIRTRKYDLLLYGISIGPDPDVFAYWQSSQVADPGLNLSQYASPAADKELEAARLTSDLAIRAARYKKFLNTWTSDVPAVVLYEPGYLYATNTNVQGIVARRLGDPADRFYNVQNWTVNTRPMQRRQ